MRHWQRRTGKIIGCMICLALAGCGGVGSRVNGAIPAAGMIPDATVQVSRSFGIPLEKIVYWGAYAGVAWLVLDPLAPHWQIEQVPLPGNHIHLSLKMKRYHTGGEGEARQLFQRRARELVQYGGFDGFEIREYSEGQVASLFGAQRTAEGVIHLTGQGSLGASDQEPVSGAPPARMTPASATKLLS